MREARAAADAWASRAKMLAIPLATTRLVVWLSNQAAVTTLFRPTASGYQRAPYPIFSTDLAKSAACGAVKASMK